MKKLTAISVIALALTTCSISATAETKVSGITENTSSVSFIDLLIDRDIEMTLLQEQVQAAQDAQIKELEILLTVQKLEAHVGKTWYVFSGSTPNGWDCSGLVLWFYKHFDIELEHSATAQKFAGEIITEPMVGDIVAFSHPGTKMAFHNGIYIGNGNMIDSPSPGKLTRIKNIFDFADANVEVSYTRIEW